MNKLALALLFAISIATPASAASIKKPMARSAALYDLIYHAGLQVTARLCGPLKDKRYSDAYKGWKQMLKVSRNTAKAKTDRKTREYVSTVSSRYIDIAQKKLLPKTDWTKGNNGESFDKVAVFLSGVKDGSTWSCQLHKVHLENRQDRFSQFESGYYTPLISVIRKVYGKNTKFTKSDRSDHYVWSIWITGEVQSIQGVSDARGFVGYDKFGPTIKVRNPSILKKGLLCLAQKYKKKKGKVKCEKWNKFTARANGTNNPEAIGAADPFLTAEVQGWLRRQGLKTDPLFFKGTKVTNAYIWKMKAKFK